LAIKFGCAGEPTIFFLIRVGIHPDKAAMIARTSVSDKSSAQFATDLASAEAKLTQLIVNPQMVIQHALQSEVLKGSHSGFSANLEYDTRFV
jgi:hypothetical protein